MEKNSTFSLVHDATSHWVKEINTVIIRVVADDGEIFKVPFSMKKVPGSFTGEALCEELIDEISSIKVMKFDSAATKVPKVLKQNQPAYQPEYELKMIHDQLKVSSLN